MEFAIAISGALVGAASALGATLFAARKQREREYDTDVRLAVADAIRSMADVIHSMTWITWHAANDPQAVNADLIASYTREVHEKLPSVAGSLAVVAALRHEMYVLLWPISKRVYTLDVRIGEGVATLRRDRDAGLRELGELSDIGPLINGLLTETIAEAFGAG